MQTVDTEKSTKVVFVSMLGVLVVANIGIYWSMRIGIANWFGMRRSLRASITAIALARGNEKYLRLAAELAEEAGEDGSAYYRKAVTVDTYAANDWMQLGFH